MPYCDSVLGQRHKSKFGLYLKALRAFKQVRLQESAQMRLSGMFCWCAKEAKVVRNGPQWLLILPGGKQDHLIGLVVCCFLQAKPLMFRSRRLLPKL